MHDVTSTLLSLASLKSRFWCWLTQIVLEKRSLNRWLSVFHVNLDYHLDFLLQLHQTCASDRDRPNFFMSLTLSHQSFSGILSISLPFLPPFDLIMAALSNRAGHYIFALWLVFSCSILYFSSPNLSGRRLDVYHTSIHGVAFVQI